MIGILGGTFDPVHEGHLHIALAVRERLGIEQVHLMPCASPVHRPQPRASAADRCAMIEAAIAGRDGLLLNRLEIERRGDSYTVDSLRQLRQRGEGVMALLLGADAFNGFGDWREPETILELANLVVCRRPGAELRPGAFASRFVGSTREFCARANGAIVDLEVDAPDYSSSALRASLAAGQPAPRQLAPAVARYIDAHQLYRDANG